ncbi:unnamed protein product [Rhizophagus irregularis]|nr:unnamed protein product [Rhizophagus irregularis]
MLKHLNGYLQKLGDTISHVTLKSWDVIDFLEKCDLEPFDKKVNQYIRCLNFIADDKDEQVCRRRKADALLKRYRNVRIFFKKWERKISGVAGVQDYSALVIQGRYICIFAEPQNQLVPLGHRQPNSVILCSRPSAYKHLADLVGWNQMGVTLLVKNITNSSLLCYGSNPDQKRAKDWGQKRKSSVTGGSSSIIIHNSTLSGNSLSGNSLGISSIARSSVNETKKQAHPTFNVQASRTLKYQMLSSSSSVPLTIRNETKKQT